MSDTRKYTLLTVPIARRSLKKLPKQVKAHLIQQLQILTTNPQAGGQLKAPFTDLRSFHTKFNNVQYRVIYIIKSETHEVYILYASSRENFYKQINRVNFKQLLEQL